VQRQWACQMSGYKQETETRNQESDIHKSVWACAIWKVTQQYDVYKMQLSFEQALYLKHKNNLPLLKTTNQYSIVTFIHICQVAR
jgi:hypothetical protein